MTTSKVTNKQVAQCFREAKKILARNKNEIRWHRTGFPTATVKYVHICYAICNTDINKTAGVDVGDAAAAIIRLRMNNHIQLEYWLRSHGIPRHKQSVDKMQAYRHAWLNMLIEEFENKKGRFVYR